MKLFILTFVTLIGLNALAKDEGITPEQKQKVAGLLRQISELDGGIEVTGVTDEAGNSSVTAKVSSATWSMEVIFDGDNQPHVVSIGRTFPRVKASDSKGKCSDRARKLGELILSKEKQSIKISWSSEAQIYQIRADGVAGFIETKFNKNCKLISLVHQGVN